MSGRPAHFTGWCNACDRPVRVGEPIVPKGGGYVHAACAEGDE